ncbi:MAG: SusC/RagA family TonB-linked outer membrane protein [Flavitalea sp.]
MKLALLLTVISLQAWSANFGQAITISIKNASLEKVFNEIRKQSNYRFIYTREQMAESAPVSLNIKEATINEALDICMRGQRLTYSIDENQVIIFGKKELETIVLTNVVADTVISGRVLSSGDKSPLTGASVMIKENGKGVFTDINGIFKLPAFNGNETILISYTGYVTQEIKINGRTTVNVSLVQDDNKMSEVVVTAMGVERQKKSLGFSATVIDAKPLAETRETNILNSLKGRVAGVYVNQGAGGAGSASYVVIRGAHSFNSGKNQPLYIVDGIPITNESNVKENGGSQFDFGDGVSNINPDDVESMTVLKGPNASSLYGSRGANGVILITTKKGKAGKGARVSLNSNATFERPNSIPKFQRTWGGGYDDDYASFDEVTLADGSKASSWPNWLIDNWGGKLDGRPIVFQNIPNEKPIPYTAISDKELMKFFNTGKTYTNSLTMSGGNEATTYRVSASNLDNSGITPNSELHRRTIDVKLNSNISNRLSVSAKANYINQTGKNRPSIGGTFLDVTTNVQLTPVFIPLSFLKNYENENGSIRNFRSLPVNPYWVVNKVKTDDTRERLIGFVSAEYKLLDWLKLMGRTGLDYYTDNSAVVVPDKNPIGDYQNGYVKNEVGFTKESNSDFLLTASGKIQPSLIGSFSVGGNHRDYRHESVQQVGRNKDLDNLWIIENMKSIESYKFYNAKTVNSLYFAGQLAYNNYLFLDITGRNDWSSSLGKNNYSFFYPSASASFVFTDIPAFRPSFLTYGKLRLSYGQAGNDSDPYQTQSGYYLGSVPYIGGQRMMSVSGNVPLADLKNELTTSFEAGTELRFFNDRLGLDLTYYDATTENQIMLVRLPLSTGYSTKLINAGAIRNRGIEVLLNGTIVKGSAFGWDVSLNLSKNKSKVVRLTEQIKEFTLFGPIVVQEGQPFGNIVGSAYKRSPDGRIVVDGDGNYLADDNVKTLGNIQPKLIGGFTNTFTFKGIELRALVDARIGGKVYSRSKQDQWQKGTGVGTENPGDFIVDGVVEQPDKTYIENTSVITRMEMFAFRGWSDLGEEFVLDATTVSLREVSLGYNFKTSIFKNAFKGIKLSLVGRNLAFLYRGSEFAAMGISAESSFAPTAAAQGIESRNMPVTRSVGINLNLSF